MFVRTFLVSWQKVISVLSVVLFAYHPEGVYSHNGYRDIVESTGTFQVVDANTQVYMFSLHRKDHSDIRKAQARESIGQSPHSALTVDLDNLGRGVPNTFRRRRGMISQMSLGLGALSDKSMMYGPGVMTSGNAPGSSFAGSVGISSMSSGPFVNNGMSASMFPAGLSNDDRGIPSGLSNGNSGASPFAGSSSMKGGSNRSPFNMAMLSMQSQSNMSPSMGGITSSNSGSSQNSNLGRENSGKSETNIIYGDTTSIQYINGKIIVPKNWSLDKVNQLKAKIDADLTGKRQNTKQAGCPRLLSNCPKSCIVFSNNGCPVCSCKDDICPAFPAGCRKGRVRINKDGCPVCVSKDSNHDWYNTIWDS